jgi:CRISPR-associated protein Csd1
MIIPSLIHLYDRLASDPEGEIADEGFSRQKVSFVVVLRLDGTLVEVADNRLTVVDAKRKPKLVPATLVVCGQSKPSGSGFNPCFLWDNSAYMLGYKPEDPKPHRTRASFKAFRDAHLARRGTIDDAAYEAVCRFLEQWNPDDFAPTELQREYLTAFGTFRIDGERRYVHERAAVDAWYRSAMVKAAGVDDDDVSVPSLTTGIASRIARLHEPKIQGVRGAQSSGATLVSFNAAAFESYGKEQGNNAPVAVADAFKYCTALNKLLADAGRRTQLGDATVVWWSDAPVDEVTDRVLAALLGPPRTESAASSARLGEAMLRLARGELPHGLSGAEQGFHVLGLSPNAARLSVRLWWSGSIGGMIECVRQFQADLQLDPVPPREEHRPFSIWRVVSETARVFDGRPDLDTVSPTLAGEVARAVLSGGALPLALLQCIIRRIRSDGEVGHGRTAIVKACINRHRRLASGGGPFEEVPVALDVNGPEPYQLGRLFAVLEKTQGDALPELDATIRDRYFGAASSAPASVMPRLVRLAQHHLGKLERGRRVNRERLLQEVVSHIQAFPTHLNIEQQGLFQVGYYHQRADLYTKKPDAANETPSTEGS